AAVFFCRAPGGGMVETETQQRRLVVSKKERHYMANIALPGNPRYQPKDLVAHFGYDNLVRTLIEVELATLRTLCDVRVVCQEDMDLLTPDVEARLFAITTSQVDTVEREITKHDIRALVRVIQEVIPEPLRRWIHVPLTSYDVIDTARSLQFLRAHTLVLRPKTHALMQCLLNQAIRYAKEVQIGRTHGQHALPITVGFWFATILNRVFYNWREAEEYSRGLVGKISGAVGAYNAQAGLGMRGSANFVFEDRVLERLGLRPAPISTQVLPPEPLAYYLYSCLMLSASLGQFGRDSRHLMRTEIAELAEPFETGQVGSSTMAHKRNPLHFENLEGMWLKNKSEFGKVLDTMISEHQRDLVGSSLARDFPTLIVNLTYQLDTLLRKGKDDTPFLGRLVVDTEACRRNFAAQGDRILAEPFYLALQMHGYEGDAHELINHKALPLVGREEPTLFAAVQRLAYNDPHLGSAWERIPHEVRSLLSDPTKYTGRAEEKVEDICATVTAYLASHKWYS
ncbi:MAG: lyase family protein, partial [Minisyncoccia bacterium]